MNRETPATNNALATSLAISALTVVLYWPALRFEFVALDDTAYVTANPDVRAGVTFDALRQLPTLVISGNWHPVTALSHMIDCHVYGTQSATGHHATNIAVHGVNAGLMCFVWWRMTGQLAPSALVAALFAFHPLRVESVAWVAERKDVLSGLFALLTIWAYLRFSEQPSGRRMALVTVFFALGLMSKPMLVTLPLVLVLLDVWPLRRLDLTENRPPSWRNDVVRLTIQKWPLILCSLAMAAITVATQATEGVRSIAELPIDLRVKNAAVACTTYVEKTVWPFNLAAFYPFPKSGISFGNFVTSLAALLLVSGVAFASLRRRAYFTVGWCWYLVMLVPVIGFVQVGGQAYADRYTYLPVVGLTVAIAWGLHEWLASRPRLRAPAATVCVVVLIALCVRTRTQLATWQTSETLFRHALDVTDGNFVAAAGLANEFAATGDHLGALEMYDRSIAMTPNFTVALYGKAKSLSALDRPAEAVECYRQLLNLGNDGFDLRMALATALYNDGRLAASAEQLEMASRWRPEDPQLLDLRSRLGDVTDDGSHTSGDE